MPRCSPTSTSSRSPNCARHRARDPPRPHVRPAHIASFYVLDGELVLTLDAGELRAPAGAWVQLPAGLEHFVAAGGDEPVRYLSLHTPGAGALTLVPA